MGCAMKFVVCFMVCFAVAEASVFDCTKFKYMFSPSTCNADDSCEWYGVTCVPSGTKSNVADNLDKLENAAKAAFGNCGVCNKLGSTVADAADALSKLTPSKFVRQLDEMTGADLTVLVGDLGAKVTAGAKFTKDEAFKVISKMQESDAWGAIKADSTKWGAAAIKDLGSLVEGMRESQLMDLSSEAVLSSLSTFGSVMKWSSAESKALVAKVKETGAYAEVKNWNAEMLTGAKGFLTGLSSGDLAAVDSKVFVDAFTSFKGASEKVGAWNMEQIKVLGPKVDAYARAKFGQAKEWGEAEMAALGPLVSTLNTESLKEFGEVAMGKLDVLAAKTMGGAKAAKAWSLEQFKQLNQKAKNAFTGPALEAIWKENKDKAKELLGCLGVTVKCPGAVVDVSCIQDDFKDAAECVQEVVEQLEQAGLSASTGKPEAMVQMLPIGGSFLMGASGVSRGRSLVGATSDASTGGESMTTVRFTTVTNAVAMAAKSAVASVGQVHVTTVDATDALPETPEKTATAGAVHTCTPGGSVAALSIASVGAIVMMGMASL